MGKINDGGSAFPQQYLVREVPLMMPAGGGAMVSGVIPLYQAVGGMSLRDWFAGQALVAIYAGIPDATGTGNSMATAAYHLADAMLAQRAKAVS